MRVSISLAVAIAVLAGCLLLAEAGSQESPSNSDRTQMETLHKNNLAMEAQIKELRTELAKAEWELKRQEARLENYKYVHAENKNYLQLSIPQISSNRFPQPR